jgi:hypothetical protein
MLIGKKLRKCFIYSFILIFSCQMNEKRRVISFSDLRVQKCVSAGRRMAVSEIDGMSQVFAAFQNILIFY